MNKFTNKIISCFAALALALPLAAGCKSERADKVEDQAEATAEKVVEGAEHQADQMRKQAEAVEEAGEAKAERIEEAGERKADQIDNKADALASREDYVKSAIVRLDEANRDLAELDAEFAKETDAKKKSEASSAIAAAKTLRSQAQTAVDNAGTTSAATFSQVKDSTEKVLDQLKEAIDRADDILD